MGRDKRPKKPELFPIIEAFGYAVDATSQDAKDARERRWCRFTGTECEKFRQYGFGYCSVTYAAADDTGVSRTYAVCDHRVDGPPVAEAMRDHFGSTPYRLVPEIVLTNPRTSFDYVAMATNDVENVLAMETQAIDIRGGGVGPAWHAWADGKIDEWRDYFSKEAAKKGRKDTVAYGVNMANIYKRLGLQVAVKGTYLKGIGVPFYVVMQDRPFQYLRRRINFEAIADGDSWDICFMTFDYGDRLPDDSFAFTHAQTVRTTVAKYVASLSSDPGMAKAAREEFMERVMKKAGLKYARTTP